MDGRSSESLKLDTPEDVIKECDAIESAMHALKASYESHFLGIERLPPTMSHKALKKRANDLRLARIQQTALKFRANGLYNRLLTYERLWQRTLVEMENGTYHRDLYKARMRAKKAKADEPKPQGAPAPSAPAALPPPALQPLPDAKLTALFDAYLLAKKKCNEDTSKLSQEQLGATLRKQIPELLKKSGAKAVEFRVLIKNGKAMLQAVPKP